MSDSRWDFTDLSAVYINCTLKRSPDRSHTEGLAERSIRIMEGSGVAVELVRAVHHEIATGVYPDMTEHGWERDEWPAIPREGPGVELLHLARMLKDAGGIPAHGNQRSEWTPAAVTTTRTRSIAEARPPQRLPAPRI